MFNVTKILIFSFQQNRLFTSYMCPFRISAMNKCRLSTLTKMHTEDKPNRNRHPDVVFDMLEHVYISILASFHIQFQIMKNNKT